MLKDYSLQFFGNYILLLKNATEFATACLQQQTLKYLQKCVNKGDTKTDSFSIRWLVNEQDGVLGTERVVQQMLQKEFVINTAPTEIKSKKFPLSSQWQWVFFGSLRHFRDEEIFHPCVIMLHSSCEKSQFCSPLALDQKLIYQQKLQ